MISQEASPQHCLRLVVLLGLVITLSQAWVTPLQTPTVSSRDEHASLLIRYSQHHRCSLRMGSSLPPSRPSVSLHFPLSWKKFHPFAATSALHASLVDIPEAQPSSELARGSNKNSNSNYDNSNNNNSNNNNNNNKDPNSSELLVRDKIINGLFLSLSFGYALYTIFSIDQGITRGWTASEIAMRIPLDNWGAYESYLANKPVVTKTLINVIIYLLGDWLSQTVFQGKNVLDFDIGRTLRNGFIGLCFGPLVHEYYQFSDTILPPENGLITRLEKIVMDQTIYLTVKCSIYISAVGLLGGDDWPTVKETVSNKIGRVVITAWKFWPLVHCITYGLIPARHRILWVNSVDLVWNAILASQAQKTVSEDMEESLVPDIERETLSMAGAEIVEVAPLSVSITEVSLDYDNDQIDAPTTMETSSPAINNTTSSIVLT